MDILKVILHVNHVVQNFEDIFSQLPHPDKLDLRAPQDWHLETFLYKSFRVIKKDFIRSSLLLISFNNILLADFGPKPGNFDISLISSSISEIFCII